MCSSPNIEAHTTIHHVETLLEQKPAAWKDEGSAFRLPYNLKLFLLLFLPWPPAALDCWERTGWSS